LFFFLTANIIIIIIIIIIINQVFTQDGHRPVKEGLQKQRRHILV
jgi:hypothetical protein